MRIIIDIMIGLMLIAVVAGGLYLYNSRAQGERDVEAVRSALQQLQEQAAYHTAVQSAMAGRDVLLVHLREAWFGEDVPSNVLVSGERPWIDLAPPGDLGEHPPDPVVVDQRQAGFWYNPTTGVFRARVAPAASEAMTLSLYNEVNGSALPMFEVIPDTSRAPVAHNPEKAPAQQYATLANKTWSEAQAEKEELATDLIEAPVRQESDEEMAASTSQVNPGGGQNPAESEYPNASDKTHATPSEADSESQARPTLQNFKAD